MVQIRKATLKDIEAITKIASENHFKFSPSQKNGFLIDNYSCKQYEQHLSHHDHLYVIENTGHIQGFLLAIEEEQLDATKVVHRKIKMYAKNPFVVIKQVCIAKEAIKKGFGRKLYEHLQSHVDKDIFVAVVLDPYNEPSVQFHNKLGFRQIFSAIAEDQMKRGIFYWNNHSSNSHYDKEIMIEQYKQAVQLYEHEDMLNWSKVQHLFYISGVLFGVISILTGAIDEFNRLFFSILLAISLLGILSSGLFHVTLKSGIKYMQRRKQAVVEIERILIHLGGVDIVSVNFNQADKHLKKSQTTNVMRLIPFSIMIIWMAIFVASIIQLF